MAPDPHPRNLRTLLECLEDAGQPGEDVSIGAMLDATGQRSFGALLLVPGLLVFSPLSGIPGLPTLLAVLVGLIAAQLLVGRHHFWLPQWLLRRQAPRSKYDRAMHALKRPARWVDRLIRHRLTCLTAGPAVRLNALLCLLIALTMPPLELIPFASSVAGLALSLAGLGMMARDGVMVLLAIVVLGVLGTMLGGLWL